MGSLFKSLLFGKSSSSCSSSSSSSYNFNNFNNNNNPLLSGSSYDSAVALEPPVKGSYPVAGNGPNVLEEIQRSRAKKELRQSTMGRRQSIVSNSNIPKVPRSREDAVQRPQTSPYTGTTGVGHTSTTVTTNNAKEKETARTFSGFSMKAPPSVFTTTRRGSTRSIRSAYDAPPPVPSPRKPPLREVQAYQPKGGLQTYQPKRGPNTPPSPPSTSLASQACPPHTNGFVPPPLAQHHRNSHSSHRAHVDLLDAHSNIRQSRQELQHRAKAAGVRNYGEDVADRNIADFGEKDHHKSDLDNPEFSYLKSVYALKKRNGGDPHLRTGSALEHVLGVEDSSDDTQPPRPHGNASSLRSFTGSRPGHVYPPRVDSVSAQAFGPNKGFDDGRSVTSNETGDRRGRALSPLSSTAADSITEEPPAKEHQEFTSATGGESIPARGRTRVANPPPIALGSQRVTSPMHSAPRLTSPPQSRHSSTVGKDRQRAMSSASQATNGGLKSRNGSVSYSAFPNTTARQTLEHLHDSSPTSRPHTSSGNKRTGLAVEGANEPPSLEGVVDLTNTVDKDVTTKTLPAVVHETIKPDQREIRQEVITREIHIHEILQRVLPVVQTEIPPPKHYIPLPDGKGPIEFPESAISSRTINGCSNRNWKIAENGIGKGGHGSAFHHQTQSMYNKKPTTHSYTTKSEVDCADGPVISLARGEPKSGRSRTNSKSSIKTSKSGKTASRSRAMFEPILGSKKETVTKQAIPQTEYVWHHPTVFETPQGETMGPRTNTPMYIGAGIGDLSAETYFTDEEDAEGAEFGAMTNTEGEEELLLRDSGYGSLGMLPGIAGSSPISASGSFGVGQIKVAGNREEDAKLWKSIRERGAAGVRDVEKGINRLNI